MWVPVGRAVALMATVVLSEEAGFWLCLPWYWALKPRCRWLPSDVKCSRSQFLLLMTGAGRLAPVNLGGQDRERSGAKQDNKESTHLLKQGEITIHSRSLGSVQLEGFPGKLLPLPPIPQIPSRCSGLESNQRRLGAKEGPLWTIPSALYCLSYFPIFWVFDLIWLDCAHPSPFLLHHTHLFPTHASQWCLGIWS